MTDRIQKEQTLPADFANVISQMRAARDPRLPMVLSLARLNGWTLASLAAPLGITRERVRQIVAKATTQVGVALPDIPLPPRKQVPELKPPRRRLLVNDRLAQQLTEMAAVAAKVNGATPSNAPERRVGEELVAMLAALVEQGVTVYHLAQVLDVEPNAVYSRLARHGYRKAHPSQEHVRYLGRPTARMAGEQAQCKRGHLLSGPNLYVIPKTGQRVCRACQKLRHRAYLERKGAGGAR